MDIRFPTPLDKVSISDPRWKQEIKNAKESKKSKLGEKILPPLNDNDIFTKAKIGRPVYNDPAIIEAFSILASLELTQIIILHSEIDAKIYKKTVSRIQRNTIKDSFRKNLVDKKFRLILTRNPLKLYIIRVK